MQIILTNPKIEDFINEQVRTGNYSSAEKVIEAALTELRDNTGSALDDRTLAAIDESEDQIERGQFRDWKEVSAELRAKYLGK